jgi:hypothetical protein
MSPTYPARCGISVSEEAAEEDLGRYCIEEWEERKGKERVIGR